MDMKEKITKSRKERIAEERKKKYKQRKRAIVGYALATSISVSSMLVNNSSAAAQTDVYRVQKGDTLYQLSKKFDTTVKQLKEINNLTSDMIYVGQHLYVPKESIVKSLAKNGHVYQVQKGDTLWRIFKQTGIPVEILQKANGLKNDRIYPGQLLELPLEYHDEEVLKKEEQLRIQAWNYEEGTYTVVAGDTLWGIAKRFGVTVEQLKKDNNLYHDLVLIGQKLTIKKKDINVISARCIGAVDSFTVEFMIGDEAVSLKVPYGQAETYQSLSGQELIIKFTNGALIEYHI
jgi:LysM repeat protein